MQVGNKRIPDFRIDQLIHDLQRIYDARGKEEIDLQGLADILGNASTTSGSFKHKLAAMKSFGLIHGRGKFSLSYLGENLVSLETTREKKIEIRYMAVRLIPLWRILLDNYRSKDPGENEEEFESFLKEKCELSPSETKRLAPMVLKAYKEDAHIRSEADRVLSQNVSEQEHPMSESTDDLIVMKWEKNIVYLDKSDPVRAWKATKAMVDAIIRAAYEK